MKRAILLALLMLYFPLSIYGMIVCCYYCSWLIHVPVLIIGIFTDMIDIGLMVAYSVEIEDEDPSNS